MQRLQTVLEDKLLAVAMLLVDQSRARVAVSPYRASLGYWFGGGNLTVAPDGNLILTGRYRNQGDSRLGLSAGERGCELALFASADEGKTFAKIVSFSKDDLALPGRRILSIEGSSLSFGPQGVELFVSSEKDGIGYPSGYEAFLKAGCGVWTIDKIAASEISQLKVAKIESVLESNNPEHFHLKDPHAYLDKSGALKLMFCTHPFCWSSSNTAIAIRQARSTSFDPPKFDYFPRGTTWDVAISRGTCLLNLPSIGAFRDVRVTLLFYDGGESLRNLDEHSGALHRPRGYSCEELGGIAYYLNGDDSTIHRLSRTLPAFISPHGTRCSRYVDVLGTLANYYVTWQQSQPDQSQPLVINVVSREEVESRMM